MQKKQFKTLIDLVIVFPDEQSCHLYLASQKWDDGIITCPHEGCGHDKAYVFKDGIRYKCTKCKRKFTAKTGTFMEGCTNYPICKHAEPINNGKT